MSAAAPPAPARLIALVPSLTAAVSFSIADILLKLIYASGMNVMTLLSLRGLLVVAFFWTWLQIGRAHV